MTMQADLKGLLPIYEQAVKKDPYLPIIEAITNSFDSITKANPPDKVVRVFFISQQGTLALGDASPSQSIDEVVIEDYGIGFNDGNVKSFRTVASTYKKELGCKGMGRLSWLCCFKKVVIESTYQEGDELFYRELHFSLDNDVDEKEASKADSHVTKAKTRVRLLEPSKTYADKRPSVSFINQVKRVFVPYLIHNKDLSIQINLDNSVETIDYQNLKIKDLPSEPLNGIDFTIYCLSSDIKLGSSHHAFNLCGDNRVVQTESLDIYPTEKLAVDGDEPAYLYFFVISDYLNQRVSTTRDSFDIPEKRPALELDVEALYMEEIKNYVIGIANAYAQEHIEQAKNKKNTVIQEVLQEYPHLTQSVEAISNKIGYGYSKEKIIIEAVTEQARHAEQVKKELLEASKKPLSKATEAEKENLAKTIAEVTHENSLQLGHYMAYRRVVLNLLDNYLQHQDDTGTFPLEEHLHQIICPMRESHQTLSSQEHNLWLLDDRLMLLKDFYSDFPLSSTGKAESSKEADILFEKPIVLAESKSANTLNNVAVVEFKRPGRRIVKGDELKEVISKYVDPLQNGKYSHKGQTLRKADRITHAYTVLTLFDETRNQLQNIETYIPSCDRDAFSKTYPALNCIHYVIDWSRLIQDAKDRHEFFFQKLNS